jgi:hypothetical protein
MIDCSSGYYCEEQVEYNPPKRSKTESKHDLNRKETSPSTTNMNVAPLDDTENKENTISLTNVSKNKAVS